MVKLYQAELSSPERAEGEDNLHNPQILERSHLQLKLLGNALLHVNDIVTIKINKDDLQKTEFIFNNIIERNG